MARPTKLTPEVTEQIVECIERGNYLQTACEAAGIDFSTYRDWMRWGARGTEPYAAFAEAVTRARAEAEVRLLDTVRSGDGQGIGFGPAKAAAFILERTRPKRFAQRINVKVREELEHFLDVAERALDRANFGKLVEALAEEDSSDDTMSTEAEDTTPLQ